jgi:hypothetical protein
VRRQPQVILLFRLVAVIVAFAALTLSPSVTVAATPRLCADEAHIRSDGSVLFDGVHYFDIAKLKRRLISYKSQNPDCMMPFAVQKGTSFRKAARIVALMLKTGVLRGSYLVEPQEEN